MVGVLPAHVVTNFYDENMEEKAGDCIKSEVISVGSRVRCDNSSGTVRFIGEVSGYGGLWYGVDWDDALRGKHDGSVNGVKYFEATDKTSGSFVRPNKISPSITCADAVRRYYGEKEDETTEALYKAVIDDWKRQIKVPFIEMVGFDSIRKKQGTLDKLVEACVSDMNVWTAGDLGALCPSLRLLDISKNLIANWGIVAAIGAQLRQLEGLDLSKNRILLPTSYEDAEKYLECFKKLRKLTMTHCKVNWKNIQVIASMLPRLETLIVACNDIAHTAPPTLQDMNLSNIKELYLDGNPVDSWKEVLKLGSLRHLNVLSLNDCQIKDVTFDDRFDGEKTDHFANLEVLHLKYNSVKDWRSVSELEKLRNLQKLYFLKNPLLDGEDYDTFSQLIIARIGNLKELNGSEIARDARRGAEYDYLKRHGKEWKTREEEKTGLEDFLLQHSRFQDLISKHGIPDDSLLENKLQTDIISSKLIEIILKDDKTGRSFKKRLPSTMSVQKLSALVRRLFSSASAGAHGSEPSLYCLYTSKSNSEVMTIRLDNQLKELGYFSVASGDTVLIKWT